jgi:hypothetical protein
MTLPTFDFGGTHRTATPYEAAKTAAAYASIWLGLGWSIWVHSGGTVTLEIPDHGTTTYTLMGN